MKHRKIQQYSKHILESQLGPDCQPLSTFWIYRFIDQHQDWLAPHWSKSLDMQHAKYLNPDTVKSWFNVVEKFIVNMGIVPENIYGMDKSGFPTAYTRKDRVIGAQGTKTQHKQGGANCENVTGVVTICVDGSTVWPLLIFKGKNIKESWIAGNTVDAL